MSAQDLFELYKVEINSHDFNRLEPLISKDCQFWFSSGTYRGIEQTRQAFQKTWALIQNEVYSVRDVEWLFSNSESAVCTYTFHWIGQMNGQQRQGKGRGTSCFRVEGKDWKLVHEHLSAFPAEKE
jgi:ketosteroid isomerase-like protein